MIFVELDKTLKKACNQFDYRLFVAETARFELAGDCSLTDFESFSQRVNFRSFRVSFRSFRLSIKPHKIRLFRPQSLVMTAFFQSGFKSAFLPILERNQGRQERNHERRQYKITYTAE